VSWQLVNGYAVLLAQPFHATLRHVAPVHVTGPVTCNLLAVWAQDGSGGVSRKHQLGPLQRALTKYKAFLAEQPTIVAGDFNNSVFWHRPGWRINHANAVATLEKLGLASAYHAGRGDGAGPILAGPQEKRAHLPHRLHLPACTMARPGARACHRHLRGVV
jgi:exodeoxyribonuclease-3